MADVFCSWEHDKYSEEIYFENKNFRSEKKRGIKPLLIKILIMFFVIALAVEVIFYAIILPSRSAAIIEISGCENLSPYEIQKLSGLSGEVKWLSINSSAVSKRLVSSPLIASVTVEKKFPDRISIKVAERQPVAVSFAEINGKTVPMEIDKDGVVFRIGSGAVTRNLPIVTGLTFNNPRAGMKINKRLTEFFVQLDLLQKKQPVLLNEVSEIKIEPGRYGGYDLRIYPVKTRFSIITSKILTEDTLRYMLLLIDVACDTGLDKDISELDIRGSNAIYKKRGGGNE
ncbi:cell division protein FtsQ/DivIB [Treponema pedis]|uniref:cell division protein FtsQ/DivIB n=1 Tax=Treponema pedis TaxID=409322 RepID=UPI001982334D|nr:FtsQ-type POTRA domain-containing protein [Treponema pedis]QSI05269.1 cell division protein [Treponema pedis]